MKQIPINAPTAAIATAALSDFIRRTPALARWSIAGPAIPSPNLPDSEVGITITAPAGPRSTFIIPIARDGGTR